MHSSPVTGRNGRVAETVSVAQQEEGLGAKVFEKQRIALGKFVIFWKRGEKVLGEKSRSFEFVASDGQRENGNVNRSGAKTAEQDGGDFFHDSKVNLRKFAREGSELGGQKVRRNRGNDADGNWTVDGSLL